MRLSCHFCERRTGGERLPRDWRICGSLICCGHCRRQRYRQRTITMAVLASSGPWWQELCTAMAEPTARTLRHDGVWEARLSQGNPIVCLLVGDRWWRLDLKRTRSIGQTAVLEKIVAGAAIAGEVSLHRHPIEDAPRGDGLAANCTGPF